MSSAPARASASSAIRRCARRSIMPNRVGGLEMTMLSATLRSGISDSSWKMQAMPAALASAGEAKLTSLPVDHHAALVRRDDARHDLDQRRFAGAVLAEDGVDAAGMDRKLGLFERAHAAIALRHAFHAEERRRRPLDAVSIGPPRSSRRHPAPRDAPAAPEISGRAYWFSLVWPMISCAVKLMPQVGKELPTKKLSDWSGKKSWPSLKFGILDDRQRQLDRLRHDLAFERGDRRLDGDGDLRRAGAGRRAFQAVAGMLRRRTCGSRSRSRRRTARRDAWRRSSPARRRCRRPAR